MKKLLVSLMVLFIAAGCEKEPVISSPPPPIQPPSNPVFNSPPKVFAGANIQVVLPADSSTLIGVITASGSKIKTYSWEKTAGPGAYNIEQPDSIITKVRGLQEGTYIFQLTVTDSSGLQGKAAVVVDVVSVTAFEYNLDLNIKDGYTFFDNVERCPWACYYADETSITASVQLSPSNNLQIYIMEETDSAAQAYQLHYGFTAFRLSNELYASGNSSFNLKKIIKQGGGSFSGTIQLNSSSAIRTRRESAFNALPPLTVTGKIDTTTRTVHIQLKGKIIF